MSNDYRPPPALHAALRSGDDAAAIRAIEAGDDVNARHIRFTAEEGPTPLHIAAARNNVAMIAILIQSGADINARSDDGKSPLRAACDHRNFRAVQALLDHGADQMITDRYGETARRFVTRMVGEYIAILAALENNEGGEAAIMKKRLAATICSTGKDRLPVGQLDNKDLRLNDRWLMVATMFHDDLLRHCVRCRGFTTASETVPRRACPACGRALLDVSTAISRISVHSRTLSLLPEAVACENSIFPPGTVANLLLTTSRLPFRVDWCRSSIKAHEQAAKRKSRYDSEVREKLSQRGHRLRPKWNRMVGWLY